VVDHVDRALRTQLDLPLGLADLNVRVLDPCTGTASYLTAVLDKIVTTLKRTRRQRAGRSGGQAGSAVPHPRLRAAARTVRPRFRVCMVPLVYDARCGTGRSSAAGGGGGLA
jgi:hypothetical protein